MHMLKKMQLKDWRAWSVVLWLWVAFFLAYVGRQSIFSIFPILRDQLHFTEVQLGLTGGLFLWIYALGNPIAGQIADLFSKKKMIVLSLLLWSFFTLLMGMSHSAVELLSWRGAFAFAQALYIPAAAALITQLHSEYTRSTALSLHGTAQFLGVILGGWYGGFVAEWLDWRWIFWILALVGLLYGPLLYILLPEDKRPTERRDETPIVREKVGLLRVLAIPSYRALCLSFFAICAMLWMLYTWLPDFLRSKFDLSLTAAGFIATVYVQVATIVGLISGALLADRLMKRTKRGRAYVLLVGILLCSPFLHLIAHGQSLRVVQWAAVGFGFFNGLFTANLFASVFDIVPKGRQGFAFGFCNMLGALAGGFSAYLVGALKARFAVETLFSFGAALGILSGLVLLLALWRFFLQDYKQAHPEIVEV